MIAGAEAPPGASGAFDCVVSGLVTELLHRGPCDCDQVCGERLQPGHPRRLRVDYGQGMGLSGFSGTRPWHSTLRLQPWTKLDGFPFCKPRALRSLFEEADLCEVSDEGLEIPTHFQGFEDFWTPFLSGTGPALRPMWRRCRTKDAVSSRSAADRLKPDVDGTIRPKREHGRYVACRNHRRLDRLVSPREQARRFGEVDVRDQHPAWPYGCQAITVPSGLATTADVVGDPVAREVHGPRSKQVFSAARHSAPSRGTCSRGRANVDRPIAAGLGLVEVRMEDDVRAVARGPAHGLRIAPALVADGDAERQRAGREDATAGAGAIDVRSSDGSICTLS